MNNIKDCLLLVIFFNLLISFSCKKASDCEKIQNGKFYYYTKKTREKIEIERIDSLQLETNAKAGDSTLKNKVVWKANCKYDLFLNALSDSNLTGDDSIIAATPLHVDVIYIGDSFYVCIAKMTVFKKNMEFRDTMYFNSGSR